MACIVELATGYPRLQRRIPSRTGCSPRSCCAEGYTTFCVGKWHLTPASQETRRRARIDRWPLGRGFERFYGFLGGETNQWYPDLVYDNHQVEPPETPEEGYHLTEDLADQAIKFIADAQVAPDKPFFLYYCPGAAHAPHHVPEEWADRYAGQFDDGWDAYRETVFARQKEIGLLPAGRRALAATTRRARVGVAVRRRAAALRPDDGGLRRASSRTPTTRSAGCSTSSSRSASSTTR